VAARQILVICEACHRPQFANQASCVGCGAALPAVAATPGQLKSAREKLIEAYEPFLEAHFGRGRLLLLSEKQLEWHHRGGRALVANLAEIDSIRVEKRRVWETLLPAALVALAAAWPATGWVRLGLLGFSALWVVAGVVQRRAALVVRMKDGRQAALPLGIGAPALERAEGIWSTLGPELAKLGVPVTPPRPA